MTQPARFLSRRQVAGILGVSISTLWRLRHAPGPGGGGARVVWQWVDERAAGGNT